MRTALQAALVNGELFALFQPQWTIDGAKVVSAEALLRWRHPERGLIGPDDFVPYAENHELIEDVGAFMLERACRTAATWGKPPVSVNVSPLQFARADLAQEILAIAAAAGLPPARLEIEITETAPFADLDAACGVIATLRAAGVAVSLDDLGSGHATRELMRALPLDRVKLGKSVVDLCGTDDGAQMVAGLVRDARALGLGVTAEGVETRAQLAFLQACGCDRVQGYLFAQPMSGADMSDYLRRFGG